jgi:hypothetical protein
MKSKRTLKRPRSTKDVFSDGFPPFIHRIDAKHRLPFCFLVNHDPKNTNISVFAACVQSGTQILVIQLYVRLNDKAARISDFLFCCVADYFRLILFVKSVNQKPHYSKLLTGEENKAMTGSGQHTNRNCIDTSRFNPKFCEDF